jgi:hypothetical protein
LVGTENSSLGELTLVPGMAIESSTKIKTLLEQLKKMKETDPDAKAIIFSQWTTYIIPLHSLPFYIFSLFILLVI